MWHPIYQTCPVLNCSQIIAAEDDTTNRRDNWPVLIRYKKCCNLLSAKLSRSEVIGDLLASRLIHYRNVHCIYLSRWRYSPHFVVWGPLEFRRKPALVKEISDFSHKTVRFIPLWRAEGCTKPACLSSMHACTTDIIPALVFKRLNGQPDLPLLVALCVPAGTCRLDWLHWSWTNLLSVSFLGPTFTVCRIETTYPASRAWMFTASLAASSVS